MKRIVANSENLKKTFPKVYEDLFSKSSVVTSAPGSFWWTGEHGVLEGNLGILQKIPMRAYVGLEPSSPGEVKIGSFLYFSPAGRKFLPGFIEEPHATKLLTFLKEKEEIMKGGIILHILSEIPPSRGLNASGSFSVALSTALRVFWGKLSPKEVVDWRHAPTAKLLNNSNFHKTLIAAWKYESIFHGDLTSGCTIFTPMIGGDYPTICFPPHQDLDHVQNYWEGRYNHLDTKKISGVRLNEFFKFKSLPTWSFDFGLIYSGDVRPTSAAIHSAIARRKELREILKRARHLDFPKPYVFPNDESWRSYMDALKISSLEILLNLREVFDKGLSEHVMRSFFQSINHYQDILNLVTAHSPAIEMIQNHLKQIIYEYGDEFGVGTKITGGGLKGDVLFVTAYHAVRDRLDKVIGALSSEMKESYFLDYLSWVDGIEDDSVIVEQDIASKLYSSFISSGCVFVKHYSSAGFTHTDLYTPEGFERQKGTMSLLLDPIEDVIWIRKTNLDSKTIPTTVTSIKILKILLERLGKEVKNKGLPLSSYTDDRNELQSKIVSPLNKSLRKYLNKELPIKIHGSIDEFSVKIEDLPFSVHYVEKVF